MGFIHDGHHYPSIQEWRDLFGEIPDSIRKAIFDEAKSGSPGDAACVSWAVVTFYATLHYMREEHQILATEVEHKT